MGGEYPDGDNPTRMKKVVVLGSGLVGSLIATDLATDGGIAVVAVDRSEAALAPLAGLPNLTTLRADLADPAAVAAAVSGADAAVGAVPGFMGTATLRVLIDSRVPVADISFSPEDPFDLDAAAKAAGVPVVVDCGVSPGISNLAAGRAASLLDPIESVRIYVGGLPVPRHFPYEYRSVFSPTDVIEEYTRPARVVAEGKVVTLPALSEVEKIDFPGVGTLEAFLTDGLRTVMRTVPARTMREKTMRWPGHAELMRALRETGLFSSEPVDVGRVRVAPRALTEKLLFEKWRRPAGEEEFTLLVVACEGTRGGKRVRITTDLLDRTDPVTGASSMARTTGFPCAIAARMLLAGEIATPGVLPPELLGSDAALFDRFVAGLAARGVSVTESVEELPRG